MDTPITTLINKLHDLYYTKVSEYEATEVDACIFYLAKGYSPKIVTVNLDADENLSNDNQEKIEEAAPAPDFLDVVHRYLLFGIDPPFRRIVQRYHHYCHDLGVASIYPLKVLWPLPD